MYELAWSAGVSLKSITLCGEIEIQKGNFMPREATFSTFDNKLAVKMKSDEV
jgi:hypothetical protein